MKKIISVSIITIIVDQLVKILISNNLILNHSISVIDNFFNITYVRNTGAAWSILSGNRVFLIIISILVLILMYFYLFKNKKINNIEGILYGLLCGGIIGNLIDRIIYGYVIDYLDFNIIGYAFPIFNIADMCIVISVIMMIILILKGGALDDKSRR